MTCPKCGGKTAVINSREPNNECVVRRRKCVNCEYRFTTKEYESDLIKHILKLKAVQDVQDEVVN